MVGQNDLERNVPQILKDVKCWVGWAPDPGDGPTAGRPKCPVILSARERRASSRLASTWGTWQTALAFYGKYAKANEVGVGFVFTREAELVYVDVDDCLETAGGKLRAWAAPYVEPFIGCAYIETSPSGRGLHIIARGKTPTGGNGKASFAEHATGEKVPEVAIFSSGKYTTITGEVWRGQATPREASEVVAAVWAAAGIQAQAVSIGDAGPAPEDDELVEVEAKRIPRSVKNELKDCTAADDPDRSAARFRLYAAAAQRLQAVEIFSLVVQSDWYEASGAAEKGREQTWADIHRCCAKARTAAKEFEEAKEAAEEEAEEATGLWKALGIAVRVEMTKEGPVHLAVQGAHNIGRVLARHPTWKGRIRLNTFKERVELDGKPLEDDMVPALAEEVRAFLHWEREPQLSLVWSGLLAAAREHAYDPVQDYLRGLSWDGEKRLDTWLEHAGCEAGTLTRLLGRKWLISLVARALRPGCKVDTVLILEGEQGKKKSSILRALAGGGEYFTDAHIGMDKDGMMLLHGHWIVELAELATLKRAETERTKQFVSGVDLSFRPPYGRTTITRLRHFVLTGTTNDEEYFSDVSGNRRYWPVRVTDKLSVAWVEEHRDQLLAEAVAALEAGEEWWFEEQPEALVEAQEERLQADPLEGEVARFLEENVGSEFVLGTLMQFLGLSIERKDVAQRVSSVLRRAGYRRRKKRVGGLPRWVWSDPLFGGSGEVIPDNVRELPSAGRKEEPG